MLFTQTMGKPLAKVLDFLSEVLAFLLIVVLAFSFINAQFNFVTDVTILQIIDYIKTYAMIAIVATVGLEFCIKKSLILTLIYLLLVAVVVIFSFLPDVQAQLIGYLNQ